MAKRKTFEPGQAVEARVMSEWIPAVFVDHANSSRRTHYYTIETRSGSRFAVPNGSIRPARKETHGP